MKIFAKGCRCITHVCFFLEHIQNLTNQPVYFGNIIIRIDISVFIIDVHCVDRGIIRFIIYYQNGTFSMYFPFTVSLAHGVATQSFRFLRTDAFFLTTRMRMTCPG